MVTTVHGRQPVHASRKKFHAMGDKALPVCEAIRDQLHNDLAVPLEQMEVSRNGIETDQFQWLEAPKNAKPVVTIVGRLSGPKGELCYRLLDECLDADKYDIRVVTGSKFESRFEKFTSTVNFVGYTDDVPAMLGEADLVIGAGRVAMEALLCGRPTLAIGEASCIGIVDESNADNAMATNFGDIGPVDLDIDFAQITALVEKGLSTPHCSQTTSDTIRANYSLTNIVDDVERIYQDVYVTTLKREMPVIMYHRFIQDESGKGVHGTYLHIDMFDKHMALLKKMGFETLTFEDLQDGRLIRRLEAKKRYIMLTVDDGYVDNLELMLPVLQKYGFKAVVYVVTGETFNRWDVENPDNPEKSVPLMNAEQVKQLVASGHIEIGGHTLSHPKLDTLTDEQQRFEIVENKKALEATLGKSLTSFAYPFGEHNQASKQIAKEAGYQYAVATNSGPLAFHQDPHQIRRIAIFPKTDVFGLWRKVRGNYLFRKVKQ